MEFPHLGNHCSNLNCHKLDFLPIKCDACDKIFCNEHYNYTTHNCSESYKKDNQVPVCPLCNTPIPVGKELPDVAVGAHMDNDCQSDPAKKRRKVFTNRCTKKGCKIREVIPVLCKDCSNNFCLKHRHPTDHDCQGKLAKVNKPLQSAVERSYRNQNNISNIIQGNMSEDEALARALALSMQDNSLNDNLTQEELDLALARQLQEAETPNRAVGDTRTTRDRCHIS